MSSIDLRTVAIKPLRHTYAHVARRLGGDKPATRYQEGTFDLQPSANFHYRPTWDPDHVLFDTKRSAIQMADWYALRDPRQFYYGTYTLARARMQEIAEANFAFVENHGLIADLPVTTRDLAVNVLIPLRHMAWGANMNNAAIGAYGYGAAFTQAAVYHAMDHLGIAQYLTRAGLLLGDAECLEMAHADWIDNPQWQGLRRYVEDSLVIKDPFELHVAQNLVLDGLVYPMFFEMLLDKKLANLGGTTLALLTQFITDWSAETRKWVDSTIKITAAESAENRAQLEQWIKQYRNSATAALAGIAQLAFQDRSHELLDAATEQFNARVVKLGIEI